MADVNDLPNDKICPQCKEKLHPGVTKAGNHVGNSGVLGGNILEKKYGGAEQHPLCLPNKTDGDGQPYAAAQAHHLIVTQAMQDDDDWGVICANNGYSINHENNGVYLPGDPRIACDCQIPLHQGSHKYTDHKHPNVNYPAVVIRAIRGVKKDALQGKFCKSPKDVVNQLDKISKSFLNSIMKFSLTLTSDGPHYRGGNPIGCSNHKKMSMKRKIKGTLTYANASNCQLGRGHGFSLVEGADYYQEK